MCQTQIFWAEGALDTYSLEKLIFCTVNWLCQARVPLAHQKDMGQSMILCSFSQLSHYLTFFFSLEQSLSICACLVREDPISDGSALHVTTNSSSKSPAVRWKAPSLRQSGHSYLTAGRRRSLPPTWDKQQDLCESRFLQDKAAGGKASARSLQGSV